MGKIIVYGLGFVGITLSIFLALKNKKVIGVDIDKQKIQKLQNGISPIFEPGVDITLKKAIKNGIRFYENFEDISNDDIIFVTVGTPSKNNGSINLEYIKNISRHLSNLTLKKSKQPLIVFKSTIIPGTFERTIKPIFSNHKSIIKNIIINPEFLKEGSALNDTINPHLIVIGGEKEAGKCLEKFYREIYGKKIPIEITNHSTAELIKYANNSFLATKISFINSIANLCQKLPGTNIDTVAKSIGKDPRIGSLFLNAGPGYGGSCFPKDVKALISLTNKLKSNSELLTTVDKINLNQVDVVLKMIMKHITMKNPVISILGLAFKENSDDIRESTSIKLIEKLLKKNIKIKVHDPKAMNNIKKIFDDKIQYSSDIVDCVKDSNCLVILTPWKEYFNLSNNELKRMKTPLIIDTRRILVNKKLKGKYIALGIGN